MDFLKSGHVTIPPQVGNLVFVNVKHANCIGDYACRYSQFVNVTNIYCEGQYACEYGNFFGVSSLECYTDYACLASRLYNVAAAVCDGENSCSSTEWYGLSDGSTSSPISTVECNDVACTGVTLYNTALTRGSGATCNGNNVYCGTVSSSASSNNPTLYTGTTYYYD